MSGRTRLRLAWLPFAAILACGADEPLPEEATGSPRAAPLRQEPAENAPPVIEALRLEPEEPLSGDVVTAQVEVHDPDGDEPTLRYEWRVDGETRGESGDSLRVEAARGALIELRVSASDGIDRSATARALARVGNRPPEVVGVVLEPAGELTVERDLSASPRAHDPDGDPIEYVFDWRVNGRAVGDGGPTLSRRAFERGDRIELSVVARDDLAASERFAIEPITVANAQPRIASEPGGLDGDAVFRYRVRAEDPDGDRRFRFQLAEGPDGMALDDVTGELHWAPREDQPGAHRVEVRVRDGQGGEAAQVFEVTVAVEESPPPASPE